jgi:hypothetical protein
MANIRMMPPQGALKGNATLVVKGRSYTCAVGQTLDVPDFDAPVLEANGWVFTALGGVGSTTQRPSNPPLKTRYHDTTLSADVLYVGNGIWVHHDTGASA